jgi:hypothetical protein
MSVNWKSAIMVNYWQDKDKVMAEVDRQVAEVRERFEAEYARLTGIEEGSR